MKGVRFFEGTGAKCPPELNVYGSNNLQVRDFRQSHNPY